MANLSLLILHYFSCFQLKDYCSLYEGYVPMKYKRYYKKMAKYVKLFRVSSSVIW